MNKSAQELAKQYIQERMVMQLATINGAGQPWLCTVHYVTGTDFSMYWVSLDSRRHSQDIAQNPKAAVAVVVKAPEHPVVGIQMEGKAEKIEDKSAITKAMRLYSSRHHLPPEIYEMANSEKGPARVYKFTPRMIVLFSEVDFPDNPRQAWNPARNN